MFRFRLPWFSEKAPIQGDIPKSFTVTSEKNQLVRFSMEDTIADFVDIGFKKLTYAEVASMSRNKKQSSSVPRAVCKEKKPDPPSDLNEEDLYAEMVSEEISEKIKINNHFMKKVYKSSDRRKK